MGNKKQKMYGSFTVATAAKMLFEWYMHYTPLRTRKELVDLFLSFLDKADKIPNCSKESKAMYRTLERIGRVIMEDRGY